ncbi:MAG: ribosome biogenesis GTPase Der [Bacteroidetes bacterium]|nr:ribosome biogenesis GTPase Der [Bacteroidota bacterium]MBK9543887.1 ribosome biogenesis GTPase Der [Bacteroidota bacterium]MBL0256638.1 ribosome biogenesis GTPase Der [Bacteroidota bacterium]MBP6650035.1 ribosome biogenesis GTPase Der [Bacteroidia bacterium]
MSTIVAIVGRPNVGKSTLFNRLTESRKAIVDEHSGVTRDRHYGHVEWNGKKFSVIDTGGYVRGSDDIFESEIRRQVEVAIEEADIFLFVVDVEMGITDLDDAMAAVLRKSKKKVFLVANKVDNPQRIAEAAEFYKMGLGDPYCVSSISGSGTGELLDDLVNELPKEFVDLTEGLPRFAIVGQPNVGKSSLLNMLTGEERSIVTPLAGTTRDTIDQRYSKYGHDFLLIDTAGVRRKNKVKEDLEYYSVLRSIRAIEEADVCLFMIDATSGLNAQDLAIFSLIERNNKGVIIIVNKWDLMEKDSHSVKKFTEMIESKIVPFTDVPIVFTSVHDKQRIHKALEMAVHVYENRTKKIKTSELNDFILPIIEHTPPPTVKGKYVKVKYVTQLPTHTPQFAFFCNLPQYVNEPYKRFLEKKLRERFDFSGVPINLFFRSKNKEDK